MKKDIKLKDLSAAHRALADPASRAKLKLLVEELIQKTNSTKRKKKDKPIKVIFLRNSLTI